MDLVRIGSVVRAVRVRSRLRQADVAATARTSPSTVSRIERGVSRSLTVGVVEDVCAALRIRLDVTPRWRGSDLPRLQDAAHAALADRIMRRLAAIGGWVTAAEVSFAVYGERGSIDIFAWHPARAMLLVVEVKTRIVDLQELLGSLDRKRRLARRIALERGWDARHVSVWLVVGSSTANRSAVRQLDGLLGNAFPLRGRAMDSWLREPVQPIAGLSFVSYVHPGTVTRAGLGVRRVRRARRAPAERGRAGQTVRQRADGRRTDA